MTISKYTPILLLSLTIACDEDKDSEETNNDTTPITESDTASQTDTSVDTESNSGDSPTLYSLEDRWVLANYPNTMYEFTETVRLTYYCELEDTSDCDDAYWSSLDESSAIPEQNAYTFDGETLIIDLNFGNTFEEPVFFECNGDRIAFGDSQSELLRVGGKFDDC